MRQIPILAFALFVPAVLASAFWPNGRACHADAPSVEATSVDASAAGDVDEEEKSIAPQDAAAEKALLGLWSRFDGREDGKPLRFYYFHDGGIGLYRYGRVGLNNTHSYAYAADGKTLKLTFKKTGKKASTSYRIIEEDGRQVLLLQSDPYEPTTVRYYKEMGPMETAETASPSPAKPGFDRMWTHVDKFVTGGMEFSIYQFKPPALDGRGVGWHHRGDFNNWSTETLFYRRDGNGITLVFPQRKEHASSTLRIETHDGKRVMSLDSDPRNYWQSTTFVDGGRAFSAEAMRTFDGELDGAAAFGHLLNHTAGMQ